MFGIPEWAIGVSAIVIAFLGGIGLMYRLLPPEARTSGRRHREGVLHELEATLAEMRETQKQLGDVGELQRRLAEVEERLDFAERLLAQQREVERLPADRK